MPDARHEVLDRGLAELGLALPESARAQLLHYLDLLQRWNRAYNLTAVRDPLEQVQRHLIDSLRVLPHVRGKRVLDVGSGAGLPGIPLAIADPDRHYTLLDSRGKRLRFLFQVKTELGLNNVELVQSRVEAYRPDSGFDSVLSRAFASLADFSRLAGHTLADDGRLLAMKAHCSPHELSGVTKPFIVAAVQALTQDPAAGTRQLVLMCRDTDADRASPAGAEP